MPLSEGIAFNRSWFAYNKNVDVTPVTEARRDEAADRALTVLRCYGRDGALAGVVTWLGIHGTTEAWSIGKAVSSGCIRLFNPDIIDLYSRVPLDSRVVVLQAEPPITEPAAGVPMASAANGGLPPAY